MQILKSNYCIDKLSFWNCRKNQALPKTVTVGLKFKVKVKYQEEKHFHKEQHRSDSVIRRTRLSESF